MKEVKARPAILRRGATALATALMLVAVAVTGLAALHLRMTDSLPKEDQTVTEAPTEIRVWFNQETTLAVSRLALQGPEGSVEMGKAVATDNPKSFKAGVIGTLTPGSYRVTWRTAGDDGHVLRGRFSFTLAAPEHR